MIPRPKTKAVAHLCRAIEVTMRILLVEDEEKVSHFIERGLVAERFAVDTAHDGTTGLELASTYHYDLIILDLLRPGLSGSEVLGRIRRNNSHVPILILTARDAIADKVENFEAGADDYLTKPSLSPNCLYASKRFSDAAP